MQRKPFAGVFFKQPPFSDPADIGREAVIFAIRALLSPSFVIF
jgi:hypothetical protein